MKDKVEKACESGFPHCFLTGFTKFFEEVCCSILASSQRNPCGYIEFQIVDFAIKKKQKKLQN